MWNTKSTILICMMSLDPRLPQIQASLYNKQAPLKCYQELSLGFRKDDEERLTTDTISPFGHEEEMSLHGFCTEFL